MGSFFSSGPTIQDWEQTERYDAYSNPKTHWSEDRVVLGNGKIAYKHGVSSYRVRNAYLSPEDFTHDPVWSEVAPADLPASGSQKSKGEHKAGLMGHFHKHLHENEESRVHNEEARVNHLH